MADEIVIKYGVDIKSLEAGLAKVENELHDVEAAGKEAFDSVGQGADNSAKKVDTLNKKTKEETSSINKLKQQLDVLTKSRDQSNSVQKIQTYNKEIKKTQDEIKKLQNNTGSLRDELSRLAGNLPFASAVQTIMEMGSAIGGVTKAAQGASTGMKVLKAAIIGSGIGALLVGLLAVIAFFKRTDEGAAKLEGIMGGLGAAFDQVTGSVAEFGSSLFEASGEAKTFGERMQDVAKALQEDAQNRVKGATKLWEGLKDLFKGEFKKAIVETVDGVAGVTLGVDNLTQKLIDFSTRVAKAAEDAYKFALAMDNIGDRQRELDVLLSANRIKIVELIKQSKNHSLAISERIANLKEANRLDEEGLKKNLGLAEEVLEQLKIRNKTEFESINQRKLAELELIKIQKENTKDKKVLAELTKKENEIQKKFLSINDELAQEVADQQIKINNMKADSVALQERNNNSIAALIEEGIQEELKLEETRAKGLDNIQKQALIDGIIKKERYEERSKEILIESLEAQKAILVKHGKDTTDIETAILNAKFKEQKEETKKAQDEELKALELAHKQQSVVIQRSFDFQSQGLKEAYMDRALTQKQFQKESQALTEQFQKNELKRQIKLFQEELNLATLTADQRADIEAKLNDAKNKLYDMDFKKFEEKEKKKKELLKQIGSEVLDLASQTLNGFNDLQLARDTAEIESEMAKNEAKTNDLIKNLEKRKEAGLLSEEDFNAQKRRIDAQQAQKENALKKKQFEADQRAAITKINIDTALAVVKTFANLGFPAAIIPALGIAAAAEIQKAFIRAQPVPKFKDGEVRIQGKGTHTSDSIPAMISKDESVINAKQSIKHAGVLHAINDDYFDKYVHQNYLIPALRKEEQRKRTLQERQAGTAEALMKSLELNGFGDLSHLERLTKNNKKVVVENLSLLPSEIGKEISRNLSNKSYMI